ncbi:Os05g0423701 [Oryza sativa Japonica Group]|uniref:Os05g0423701 protein n=1 Tax=Oryza sativa subsp. japonica TaxID=39947 RepID=A0A0P0WMQ6_ORYSJ|nr:hypothetical protein EE612_029598 [Oryza sativa]BAS94098.1 Os05g0423701 [Oryza sativa Japonica Group]
MAARLRPSSPGVRRRWRAAAAGGGGGSPAARRRRRRRDDEDPLAPPTPPSTSSSQKSPSGHPLHNPNPTASYAPWCPAGRHPHGLDAVQPWRPPLQAQRQQHAVRHLQLLPAAHLRQVPRLLQDDCLLRRRRRHAHAPPRHRASAGGLPAGEQPDGMFVGAAIGGPNMQD